MLSSVSDTLIHEGVAAGDDPSGAGDQHRGPAARARSWFDRAIPWLLHEDDSVDEGGDRTVRWQRLAGWLIVAICTVMTISIVDPHTRLLPYPHFGWIFRNTT